MAPFAKGGGKDRGIFALVGIFKKAQGAKFGFVVISTEGRNLYPSRSLGVTGIGPSP